MSKQGTKSQEGDVEDDGRDGVPEGKEDGESGNE